MIYKRFELDANFGKAKPMTEVKPRWQRTDWDFDAGILVGICSAAAMITCFYLIF